jgi:4-hydroxythreonine-4-phosphate dehydrogenase
LRRVQRPDRPVLAVTGGDPNGIGPEVVLRALLDPAVRRVCRPLLVGDPLVFAFYAKKYRIPLSFVTVGRPPLSWGPGVVPVVPPLPGRLPRPFRPAPGRASRSAGSVAGRSLERAAALWKNGEVGGIVTGPVSKETLNAAGYRYPGQTEMLAAFSGVSRALMLMLSGTLRIGLATIHLPLRRVPRAVTVPGLSETLRIFGRSLSGDFGVRRPAIAVLGLNPHAGEHGLLGSEEQDVIIPAMKRARTNGVTIDGPFPADGFFGSGAPDSYDGILAMYHDQGLVPLKMSGFSSAVNFTAGLPLVRTSPGHGTAYDIAGRGVADPGATVGAILAAAAIVVRRLGGTGR